MVPHCTAVAIAMVPDPAVDSRASLSCRDWKTLKRSSCFQWFLIPVWKHSTDSAVVSIVDGGRDPSRATIFDYASEPSLFSHIKLGAFRQKFGALFGHALFALGDCRRFLAEILGNFHRAELRSAHRTKMRGFMGFLGQRFIME
jgi:hypothetical protein